jgi:hypothetical protein
MKAAGLLDCEVRLPRRPELLSIESSDLQADPRRESLIVLNAVIRNRAAVLQELPALELTLTDPDERPLVRRVLRPEEYLPGREHRGARAGHCPRGRSRPAAAPGHRRRTRDRLSTLPFLSGLNENARHRLDRLRHHHGVPRPLQEPPAARPAAHPQRLLPHARDAARVRRHGGQHRLQPEAAGRRSARDGSGGRGHRAVSLRASQRWASTPFAPEAHPGQFTAQAFITTDLDDNQITPSIPAP